MTKKTVTCPHCNTKFHLDTQNPRIPKKAVILGLTLTICLSLFYVSMWQLDTLIFRDLRAGLPYNYFTSNYIWIPIPPWNPMKPNYHDAICYFMYAIWFSFLLFGSSMFLIGYYWKERRMKKAIESEE